MDIKNPLIYAKSSIFTARNTADAASV